MQGGGEQFGGTGGFRIDQQSEAEFRVAIGRFCENAFLFVPFPDPCDGCFLRQEQVGDFDGKGDVAAAVIPQIENQRIERVLPEQGKSVFAFVGGLEGEGREPHVSDGGTGEDLRASDGGEPIGGRYERNVARCGVRRLDDQFGRFFVLSAQALHIWLKCGVAQLLARDAIRAPDEIGVSDSGVSGRRIFHDIFDENTIFPRHSLNTETDGFSGNASRFLLGLLRRQERAIPIEISENAFENQFGNVLVLIFWEKGLCGK